MKRIKSIRDILNCCKGVFARERERERERERGREEKRRERRYIEREKNRARVGERGILDKASTMKLFKILSKNWFLKVLQHFKLGYT